MGRGGKFPWRQECRQGLHQLFLVGFDGQRVIAAAFEEDLLRGFQLGVERVGQRRFVLHGHLGQELARGGNFVAALRHGDGAQPSGPGR